MTLGDRIARPATIHLEHDVWRGMWPKLSAIALRSSNR